MSTRRAEGAVGPPGPRLHYAEFEAYRGVAALAVVVFHAYQFVRVDGAYVYAGTPADALLHQLDGAVAVFLVLSGFLLWEPVARALVTGAPPGSARSFLTRRAIRVVPLYVIATMVVWAWRTPGGAEGWPELATHLTFTHVFVADHVFSVIGPAWSLAVEVHAYVLLAVLIAVLARTGRAGTPRPTAALALPAVVVVVSVAWKAWAARAGRVTSRHSHPISPHEMAAISSQPTSSRSRSAAATSSSIAATNSWSRPSSRGSPGPCSCTPA